MYIKMPASTPAEQLVEEKHLEYLKKAGWYSRFYYATRLLAGLSAALLPFIVRTDPFWSTTLSVIIVVITVLDLVFSPKDRWALHSKATDLITLAKVKATGEYDKYQEVLNVITQTETANLQQLINLDDLVSKIDAAHSRQG